MQKGMVGEMKFLNFFFPQRMTIGRLYDEMIKAKIEQGLRPRTIETYKSVVGRFAAAKRNEIASKIKPSDIVDYVNKSRSAWTRRTTRRCIHTLFEFGVSREHFDKNPVSKTEMPQVEFSSPKILDPKNFEILLRCLEKDDPELIGAVVLSGFAGLRPESETKRTVRDSIKSDFVEVSTKNKTRRRRLVTIQPNLKLWLEKWLPLQYGFAPKNFRYRLLRCKNKTGVQKFWQHDILRHSFVSYHLALFDNDALTAREAGHSQTILHANYKALTDKETARAFFSIVPDPIIDYLENSAKREQMAAKFMEKFKSRE